MWIKISIFGLSLLLSLVVQAERGRGPGGFRGQPSRVFDRGEPPRPAAGDITVDRTRRSFSSTTIEADTYSSEGETAKCSDGTTVPLNLLKLITINGNGIEIEHNIVNSAIPNDQKSVTVNIPNHISTCSDFVPKVHQDQDRNTLFVTVENKFDLDGYLRGKKKIKGVGVPGDGEAYSESDLKELSPLEKYEACMTISGVFIPRDNADPSKGIKINWPEGKGYTPKYSKAINIKFNPSQDMRVLFASPIEGGNLYGAAYDFDNDVPMNFNNPAKCLLKEELDRGGVNLWDEVDRKYATLKADCEGGHLKIRNAMKRLGEFPEQDAFRKILEKQLENELEEMAEDRYKRLTELGDRIRDPNLTRQQAEQLSAEYVSYTRELKNFYFQPKLDKLKKLSEKRKNSSLSSKERAQIDSQIGEINNQIGSFEKGPLSKKMNVAKTMDAFRKQGLVDEANEVAELKLTSGVFMQVHFGGKDRKSKGMTYEEAEKQVAVRSKKYRKDSELFAKAYMAKSGEGKFSGLFLANIQSTQRKMQTELVKYQANEMKYMRYCSRTIIGSIQNPIKCKQYMSAKSIGKRRGMLDSKLKSLQKSLGRNHELYQNFVQLEREGVENLKQRKQGQGRAIAGLTESNEIDLGSNDPFTIDTINNRILEDGDSGVSLFNNPQGNNANVGLVNNPQMFPMMQPNQYNMMYRNPMGANMGFSGGYNFNRSF